MNYFNHKVNGYLLDVPLEDLVCITVKKIDESGGKIEKQNLKEFLIKGVHILKQSIPPSNYPELTMDQAHEVAQELLSQHFLTFSDENPNPKTELYFEPTQKAREITF
jgi:hypothetical protein